MLSSYLCKPTIKKIIVLDLTHKGIIIAQELKKLGFEVTGVDIYNTLNSYHIQSLKSEGIEVINTPSANFDLMICPVHLSEHNEFVKIARYNIIPIISHHIAVRDILVLKKNLEHTSVIEVTGTKAKTSTCSLLADILSRRSTVLLHTSRGLELWQNGTFRLITKGLSIAPGSILEIMNIVNKMGEKIDVFIFEISLGFIGYGNVGVLTTVDLDYLIAEKTILASNVKIDSLYNFEKNASLIINENVNINHKLPQQITFFSTNSQNKHSNCYVNLENQKLSVRHYEHKFIYGLAFGYDTQSYLTAFAAACATAFTLGRPVDDVYNVISSFCGLTGRMQEVSMDNLVFLDNSNSGMDILSVERVFKKCLKQKKRIIIVLGEEAEQVCEGLSPEDVHQFLHKNHKYIENVILVGKRMKALCVDSFFYADNLDTGKALAINLAQQKKVEDIIIALCVKCFR